MKRKKQVTILIIFFGALIGGFLLFSDIQVLDRGFDEKSSSIKVIREEDDSSVNKKTREKAPIEGAESLSREVEVSSVALEVPFVLQAPNGNWDNPIFQDACEEAAILMAEGWLKGVENITTHEAVEKINELSVMAEKKFTTFVDASIEDTSELFNTYYGQKVSRVEYKITLENVKMEISQGNLVIVPTDGRKMENPYYTSPGPITHMIVITGYDKESEEFITNDSGTRRGKGFRYDEEVLYSAIRNYPTGNHYVNPVPEGAQEKAMMVVER